MALGEVDYGLMGLVGGLTVFITFFNSLMSTAVSRFYAFSVGQAQTVGDGGVEICRKWFNTALVIHTIVPLVLLLVGYPIGEWAIRSFLTIPAERVSDSLWVWRIQCVSCFLMMISVPCNAMYQAKQYIAELTVYSFVTVTLNAIFLYYMYTHPGVWLVKLTFWSFSLGLMPQIIIAYRAFKLFPECRIDRHYFWNVSRFKELFVYAFYRFFGALSSMIKKQGLDILINKYLGPANNAAMNVGGTVSGHCNSLAGSFLGALSPAITNAYGAGDSRRVEKLSMAACKLSSVMVMIFIVPLLLEVRAVMELWLVKPPAGADSICICLMTWILLENLSCGLYMPIFADGRIKGYQMSCLMTAVLVLPLAWFLLARGVGILSVGYALIVGQLGIVLIRMYFARRICSLPSLKWFFRIFVPIALSFFIAFSAGYAVKYFMAQSFLRIVCVTVVANVVLLPLVWFLVFDKEDCAFVKERILQKFKTRREHGAI